MKNKVPCQNEEPSPQTLAERRAADREARRQIEDANKEAQAKHAAYQARISERNAALKAEAEEKEAAAQAKAEAKAKAAQEKAEAKAEAARVTSEAKEAAAKAKAEAAQKKKVEAEQRAEAKVLLQGLKASLRDEAREQTKALGAPLAELVRLFVEAFSARKDVHALALELAEKKDAAHLFGHSELPVDVLCWLSRPAVLEFNWAWEPDGPAVGQVSVPDLEGLSLLEPAEASSKLAAVRTKVAQAFIEPSQQQDFARLLSNSALPFSTTNCLVQGLIEKNIDPKQAKTLVKWLGEDARILLHRTETEEGRRRDEVLAATSESDTKVDRMVVNRLNIGPALEKHYWMKLLAQHSAFLEGGVVEGTFEITSERGVPSFSFKSDASAPGQALLNCENLTGANMKEARLAYAGMLGVRAEKVSFASADLSHACLRYSTLSGSKFSLGDLTNCDLSDSNLEGVDFRGANLTGTNFERSNLTGANFAGALTKGTKFGAANLRGVKY